MLAPSFSPLSCPFPQIRALALPRSLTVTCTPLCFFSSYLYRYHRSSPTHPCRFSLQETPSSCTDILSDSERIGGYRVSFRPSTRPSCPHPTSSTPFRSRSHRALLLSCSRLLSVPFLVIHQRSVFQQWCINLYLRAYYSWENPWPSVNIHLRHNESDSSSRSPSFLFSGYLAATTTSLSSRLSSKL